MSDTDRIKLLDAALDDRRVDLGLQWKDVATMSGIGLRTLDRVRSGGGSRLKRRDVENALRIQAGAIERFLAGAVDKLAVLPERLPERESPPPVVDPDREDLRTAFQQYLKTHQGDPNAAEDALAILRADAADLRITRSGPENGQKSDTA